MSKIPVIVSGLPGKMATSLAETIEADEQFQLLALGLTGPDMGGLKSVQIGNRQIRICPPTERQEFLEYVLRTEEEELSSPVLIADFTQPNAVINNAWFYCQNGLPFVMGTTGGDRARLNQLVEQSRISAVIAPNMAAQVVALQAAIEYMANTFPDAFSGFQMEVTESHQQGKADTSGTAKALIASFNKLGVLFDVSQVDKVRDPDEQLSMGIPAKYLSGHGWHDYRLDSSDRTMRFEFVHNISGRLPCVAGTLKALTFLAEQVEAEVRGQVFSMIDVLKAG